MLKFKKDQLIEIIILFIISVPSFLSLLNPFYFTIHDNQHPVRLFLLDTGIRQGYLYPRWVDKLSFGFGDPLFNFYPPLVYYLAEFFHFFVLSLIWSIKLVFILGFILATISSYYLARKFFSKPISFLVATIYNYSFYHAVNAYVRGALADFFTMSIIPLVFLFLINISEKKDLKNIFFFSFSLALVMLSHQLISLTLIFFLFFYFIFLLVISDKKLLFIKKTFFGGLIGLGLSSFYWLPMIIEKKYTFLDMELGNYIDHFIHPYQFWYSPWGFGASIKGINDGMSFQLGKIPIFFIVLTIITFLYFFILKKIKIAEIKIFFLIFFLTLFGLFMTTGYSNKIWENLRFLWNLQFPWRFLSVTSIFISLLCGFWLHWLEKKIRIKNINLFINIVVLVLCLSIIFKYQQYFKPQQYLKITDKELTSDEEILWRQSQTVLHFVPQGVKTKKNEYGVYVLDIKKNNLPKKIYEIKEGQGIVRIINNKFQEKTFAIEAKTPITFQLNTFNFIGWQAYINNKKIPIEDKNDYKLINVQIPKGNHQLKFVFKNTLTRNLAESISIFTLIIILIYYFKIKKQ